MASSDERVGIKYTTLLEDLRNRIVSGEMPPGTRLPRRDEIEKECGCSRATVQRAFDELIRDGFVEPHGRSGTFVSETPPHLSHFGLAFPSRPETVREPGAWLQYWQALASEARSIYRSFPGGISVYYDVLAEDSPGRAELIEDIRRHRLSGLIVPSDPIPLLADLPGGAPAVPVVTIMNPRPAYEEVCVLADYVSLVDKALDYFASQERKRIAVVGPWRGYEARVREHFLSAIAAREMTTRPQWEQCPDPTLPHAVRNAVHLCLEGRPEDRPDGLLILDDNISEHATAGVLAAGLRAPEDIEVVVHTNFPWPVRSVVQCKRIGFDVREILRTAMDVVLACRNGNPPPPVTWIAARTDDEPYRDSDGASPVQRAIRADLVGQRNERRLAVEGKDRPGDRIRARSMF